METRYIPGIIQTRAMGAELPENDDNKYWIRVEASNDKLDLHNSIMDPETTLKNFESDAKTSPYVALKDHHGYYSSRSFGYGRSAEATLTPDNRLLIDFFILKGMEYGGSSRQFTSSEQLIRAIEQDLINQVSVGFYGEREVCNICNLPVRHHNFWDWDWDIKQDPERCSHKMGKEYDVGDGKMETATYTVYDAHLKEVSLVEFGSNRKTSIAQKREMRSFMEELFMTDQEWIAKLREALDIPTIKSTDDPDAVVETLQNEVIGLRETVETQKDEIADLKLETEDMKLEAADGKAYRQARIDEGIKQGVRAHGEDFDEDYHREYYADLPLDKLEKAIENNKKIGDRKLPGGRATTDDHEPAPEEKKRASEQDRKRRVRNRLRGRR